jgi:hypothetical protein
VEPGGSIRRPQRRIHGGVLIKQTWLSRHLRSPSPTFAFLNDKRTSCEAPVAVEYAVTLRF